MEQYAAIGLAVTDYQVLKTILNQLCLFKFGSSHYSCDVVLDSLGNNETASEPKCTNNTSLYMSEICMV